VVTALALLFCGVGQAQVSIERIDTSRPLDVHGHRGFGGRYSENSRTGFEQALALGVSTIQLNVQATLDRVLVVYRDSVLDARHCVRSDGNTAPRQPLAQLQWSELSEIVCGLSGRATGSPAERATAHPIPRLQELLELVANASYLVKLSIEIEPAADLGLALHEFADLLATELERMGLSERTTVRSRDPQVLLAMRERLPRASRAIVVGNRRSFERMLQKSKATIISPPYKQLRLDDVKQYHRRGINVVPWIVNDPVDIRRMILWGVDGIVSDYPDRVQRVWHELNPNATRSPSGAAPAANARSAP
jgi:glycerophosphoryl diester phosphodiesterase